jgi:Na+-transporting methylmalonyl-CoA/oxaloacetate decarboxylase gamma subunit
MIDWGLVGEIAGGGYGLGIFVLIILSLVIWVIGLVVQRATKAKKESQGLPTKEK